MRLDRWTPQAYSNMFATALLHWRRADARAPAGSLGQASATGAAEPYALWPRARGRVWRLRETRRKKSATAATIAIVEEFQGLTLRSVLRDGGALRRAPDVKGRVGPEASDECDNRGLTSSAHFESAFATGCRSATPAVGHCLRCALETPPAIGRWSRGLSSAWAAGR